MAPVQLFLRGIQGNTQAVWACPDQSVLELKGAVEVSVSKPFKSGRGQTAVFGLSPPPSLLTLPHIHTYTHTGKGGHPLALPRPGVPGTPAAG